MDDVLTAGGVLAVIVLAPMRVRHAMEGQRLTASNALVTRIGIVDMDASVMMGMQGLGAQTSSILTATLNATEAVMAQQTRNASNAFQTRA
jgi:hypothetical protein